MLLSDPAVHHVSLMADDSDSDPKVDSASHGSSTVPSRKRAHGQCTLHWAKIGGWADIQGTSIAFRRDRAPR